MPLPAHRQLAAILFTDMAGYTALMAKDETLAARLRSRHREVLRSCHEDHQGQILQYFGDGTLSLFQSAVQAVQCAIDMQLAFKKEPIVPLRIGIHSGEAVWDKEGIYGSAVNIASRLESFAEIGSILVSRKIREELSNHSNFTFQSLGLFELKNVPQPREVFAVANDGIVVPIEKELKGKGKKFSEASIPPSAQTKTLSSFSKSIAVLPFANMSSNPEQEYFCEGIADEIITDLTGLNGVTVISRNSSAQLKGTSLSGLEIGRKLGVRYLLTGGVRRAGQRLRITAQLIDASIDQQLWAKKFDGTLEDVFDLQEKISRQIVQALDLKLSKKEENQLIERPFDNLQAYDAYLHAHREIMKLNDTSLSRAGQLIDNALEMIGPNSLLLATKGHIHLRYIMLGIKPDRSHLEEAEKCLHQLTILTPDSLDQHLLRGMIRYRQADIQGATNDFKKILLFDSNNRDALLYLSLMYILAGHGKEATHWAQQLITIDPLTPLNYCIPGYVKASQGMFEEAIPHYRKMYDMDPDNPFVIWTYALMAARFLARKEIIPVLAKLEPYENMLTFGRHGRFLRLALEGQHELAFEASANEQLQKEARWDEHASWWMASAYALINKKELALDWLENAIRLGYRNYPFFSIHDPFLENIRVEARFKKLMEKTRRDWESFEV